MKGSRTLGFVSSVPAPLSPSDGILVFYFIYLFSIFRALGVAYGSSQARGGIGAVASGLHHRHSNARSLTH